MSQVDAATFSSSLPVELADVLDGVGLVDPDRFSRIEATLVGQGRWADLAALYEAAVARAPDAETGRRYLLLSGLLWMEKLESPRQAEPRLRRLLASDPDHPEALEALKDLCATSDRLMEAADLLDRAISVASSSDKPDLLLALAELAYPALDDPNRALSALRYAYECDPSRSDVASAARRVFVAERRWFDAKRVLDDQSAAIESSSEARASRTNGVVTTHSPEFESAADDAAAATEDVSVPADPDPGAHPASDAESEPASDQSTGQSTDEHAADKTESAAAELADGYLELALKLLPHATVHDLAQACLERARALGQGSALSRLDELAHLKQSWEASAERLRGEGFEARDKQDAADCYLQAAELVQVYAEDSVRADELVERCLLLVPGYGPALDFLETVHEGQKRLPDLARRLNAMVGAVRDPAAKVAILLREARLHESELSEAEPGSIADGARAAALTAYRRVLAIRPDHREAVQRCGALLVDDGKDADRAQVLETYLAATTDPYAQVQTHLELGRLYAEGLGDVERSRAHFEAVLTRDTLNFTAASALRALYKDAGEHAAHLSVLRVLLNYAPDRATRLEMLQQMAEVASSVGKEESFAVLRQIFELDPDGTHDRLVHAAEELQRFLPLAQSYVTLAQTDHGGRAVKMWMAAGQLFDQRLPRPQDAIHAYREALRIDGRNDDARAALERLLAEQDDPEALLEMLRLRLEETEDDGERCLLLARIGGVQDRDLGQLAEAVSTFESVLEVDPQHAAALTNLDDLHRRLENWTALENILVRREGVAESEEARVGLAVRRARLLAGPLQRADDGADAFLELLNRAPDHPEVLEGLASLVALDVKPLRIARALEPIYGQRGQYEAQVDMLSRLSRHEETVEARAGAARRAARVAESRLNDPQRAFELVADGLRGAPDHEELLDTLIRLAHETESATAAADVLAPLIPEQARPDVIASLAYRLGELREEALDDSDGAIEAYRTALDADARHAQALAGLERLLGLAERYEELAALLETRLADAEDETARVQFALALATLQDARLNETDKAAGTLSALLGSMPREPVVLSRLSELYEKLERWRDLVGILDRLADATSDPDVRVTAAAKAGDVLAQHLSDPKGALEHYRTALDARPDHGPSIRGLEGLLGDVDHRSAAGAILAPIYEKTNDGPGLVRAYEAQLAAASDADERRGLFVRIAEIEAEQLDDPGAAFEALTRAFQEGLLEDDALERLSDLAAAAHRSKSLAQVYEHAVEQSPDDPELLRALARLYEGAAGAPTRAKETWQRIVERMPGDPEALEALERLTAAGDRPEALAEVLAARADAAEDPKVAAGFLRRAAAVFEEITDDLPRAVGMMERARDLRPTDRAVWQELARYYRVLDRPDDLRDALAAEASLVEAPLERARLLAGLAETQVSTGDDAGAIASYRAALEAQADHAAAREGLEAMLEGGQAKAAAAALEPIYRGSGDWARLVDTYETMVAQADDSGERVERLMAIRSIYEERLGRPDRAFEAAGRAFAEAPEDRDTLAALERLGRASGSVDELVRQLELRADAITANPGLRAELRHKLADYAEHLLGDRKKAIEVLRQARIEQPKDPRPLHELDRLYALDGDAREQVAVRKDLAALTTGSDRANHLVTAAMILEDRLGDRPAAAFEYEQVLLQDPGHDQALDRLEALYADGRAHFELGRILVAASAHREGRRRAEALLRLGELRQGPLEDPRGAVVAFGDVLQMPPDEDGLSEIWPRALTALDRLMVSLKETHPELSADAGRILEPHWAERNEPLKLIATKEAQVAGHADRALRRRLLGEIAEVYAGELDQPEMAFMALARALTLEPNDATLVDGLERAAAAAGTEEELADIYQQAVPSISEPELALRVARRAASIYDETVERPDAAVPMYNRVLALAPDDIEALTALERLYRQSEDARGLLTVYRGLLRLAEDDPERTAALWRQVAEVADSTDDTDATFEAYKTLLDRQPEDLTILRKMAALCERTARLEDLWTVLDREAGILDGDDRAQVLLRMGTLARAELNDDARAVDAFSRALEVRPEDPGAVAGLAALLREEGPARPLAASALAPVYRASGAFESYITALEIQSAAALPGDDKRRLYLEIADVYQNRLARPERAFHWGSRALHEDVADPEVRAKVESFAESAQLWDDLAAFYLDELEEIRAPDLALTLRRRIAEIYDRHLRQPDRAIEAYNRVLDMAPGDTDALMALEHLLPEVGEFDSLGDVYRRRIAQASETEVRIQLLRQFARLQADQLSDQAGAIGTLRRLLELVPSDVSALQAMVAACEGENRTSELIETLEQLVAVEGPDTEAGRDARVQLARLKAKPRGDLAASESLLKAVISHAPDHPGAVDFLQERFEDAVAEDDTDVAERIGELLADALRALEAWPDLISVQRVRAGLSGVAGMDRIALHREAAQLYRDQLDQPDLAFAAFAQVLREAPGLDDVRRELEALADEQHLHEPLVDALEAAQDNAPDPEVRSRLDRRIAQLVTAHLHEPERAARSWQTVLSQSPRDPEALAALDPLFTDLGRWAALTDVLEVRVELADEDPDAQFGLLMRLAGIWEEWLGEPEEAVRWYEQARALRPQDPSVLAALGRLLDAETHPQALFEVLEAASEQMTDVPSRVRLWARMAKLVDERLDRPEEAIHWWGQVRRVHPGHGEALEALERLFERTNRWSELADLLEAQLTEAPDERTMIRLQRRLGLVRGTRLGSVDEAVQAWNEILKRNPNDVEALEALRQIFREAERWTDLVATLRKLIPLQMNPAGVKAIRFELAETFLTKLDSTDDAIESAKRVLDVEPHTVVELKRLEEIFVAAGAHNEAVKVMNARAAAAETRGQRIEILFDIARVYEEQLGRRAGAAAAYEAVLALEPTSQMAYEALAEAYESRGDYRKLGELYNRRLEVTERGEERRELLYAIVEIQERWLGQPELAFTVACRAFGEEGAAPEAQALAERLADETDNWDVLAEVYDEQVDQVPATRAIELRRRLAEIRLERLEEPDEAEQHLRIVLSMRPEDERARDRLIDLYEQQERWSDLVDQLAERVDLTPDVDEKKRHWQRIAGLHEDQRQDAVSAIAALKRVLDVDDNDNDTLLALARIYRAEQMWSPLLGILERRLEAAGTRDEALDLRTEIAGVWAQGVKDIPRAVEAYRDVLAIEARHPPALSALEQLLTHEERWIELVDVYERQVELVDAAADRIGLLTKIATIQEERYRDLDAASRTLIRVLQDDPEHRPTLNALVRVWRDAGEWTSLIEALERQAQLTADPGEKLPLLRQIGEVRVRYLEQVDRGEEAYNRALAIDPRDPASLHALADLHERHGNWFVALDMLKREADVVKDSADAVHLWYRAAKISEEMLNDAEAAKASYQRSLEIDPAYTPSLGALRKILEAEGRFQEVVQLQSLEAKHTDESSVQAELYTGAAETVLREFDDVPQALRLLERALEADPRYVPALRMSGDLLFAEERWTEAEAILERLVDGLRPDEDQVEQGRTYYRLAYIAEKLDADDKALDRYFSAYEREPTYLLTLEGLAAALLRAERWQDAQRIFHTILLQHRAALTEAEVVDLYFQIGQLAVRLQQKDRAKSSFDKALDLDRHHGPTLRASSTLAEEEGAWEEAYDFRERLIAVLDGEERFTELVKQAELCEQKIREPYRAIDAYAEARRGQPTDEQTLRALARLFEETSQVPRQVEVLEDLAGVVKTPAERREVLMRLAEVHLTNRQDAAVAVEVLNRVLDHEPTFIDAFQRIEQILFDARDWTALEENYHRMIRRMPKHQKKARLVLWRSLGDLYSRALKNEEGARTAYEVVLSRLDPDAHDIALKLAAIYGSRKETAQQALALYHRVLPFAEDPAQPARRMFELYHALGQLDRAFCALAALTLMRAATDDEAKAYMLLLKRAPAEPARAMTDTTWRSHILHPLCRNALSDILSIIYRGAPELFDEPIRALGLNRRKERVDLSKGNRGRAGLRYFAIWQRLANAMSVGEMEHFHRPGSTAAPRFYPGSQPVLFAGEMHEIFKSTSSRPIAWTLGRQMAAARPELALVRALPPDEVAALVEGTIRIFVPKGSRIDHKLDSRLVDAWRVRVQRMLPERALRALREPVATCVHKKDMKRLSAFLEGAEHSASRAAVLMCGDVIAAERGLGESDHLVGLSFRARVRQLMLFVLSEEHFMLREKLGLAIPR